MDTVGDWTAYSWSSASGQAVSSVSGGQSGNALKIDASSGRGSASYNGTTGLAVTIGKSYRVSVWGKNDEGAGSVSLGSAFGGSQYVTDNSATDASGKVSTYEFTAITASLHIALIMNTDGNSVLWDNVTVTPIGAVAEYDGSSAGALKWGDKSGNDLHGTLGDGSDATKNPTLENTPYDSGTEYEEGTWTPIITDGTNNATAGGNNSASYVRNGNQVTVFGFVQTNGLGSASGNIKISGLPYTIKNTIGSNSSGAISYAEGLNITENKVIGLYTQVNTTNAHLTIWEATTGINGLTAAEWSADGGATIMLTYMTT